MSDRPAKLCATCGRRFEWRAKWADDWDSVRYCSARCRSEKPGPIDADLERAILELLAARERSASICPSEAARRVAEERRGEGNEGDEDDWKKLMERTRRAARRLVARGDLAITQRGRVVDATDARGAIRLRRP